MANYLSHTSKEISEMLKVIGANSIEELFCDIPENLKAKKLKIPEGKSQQETFQILNAIAKKNKVYDSIFLGAGSYHHFIPSVVKNIANRNEFITAYTPYQAEMSQGILQSIFEYQTMICNLTGMEVSNASHYSGATAAAEACIMLAGKKKVITFDNINPDTLIVLKTYLKARDIELEIKKSIDGQSILYENDLDNVSVVYVESPNYFGLIEDVENISKIAHECKAKIVVGSNPIALGILKSQAELGADIAVGEAQPFGMPMSFGGPYLGYMATNKKEMRKLPGRIVGETVDRNGNRAFVLTLQAREQHIRREKASSNICSNEALCALIAGVYLSAVGNEGLKEVATICTSNAHYMADSFKKIGVKLQYSGEFFHEFVTNTPKKAYEIEKALLSQNILSGLTLDENRILWCTTEMISKDEMDKVIQIVGGIM